MCNAYPYHSICSQLSCKVVLGKKKRNCYCAEALRVRRFGRCTTGAKMAGAIRENERSARCDGCKQGKPVPELTESEDTTVCKSNDVVESPTLTTAFSAYYSSTNYPVTAKPPTQHESEPEPEPEPETKPKNKSKKRKLAYELLDRFEADLKELENNFNEKSQISTARADETEEKEVFVVRDPAVEKRGRRRRARKNPRSTPSDSQKNADIHLYGFPGAKSK
ncbi:hypothetical protein F4819DRAFT_509408 [Hypoxylon fuscum]|nr:hypothetical protein F4819DRAFT_509408 [Hypoxylon fuscum]